MNRILPRSFYEKKNPVLVARGLLGKIIRLTGDGCAARIVETEAYFQEEPACHGYRRRSPSNETLFGEPGRFYVGVSYCIHHCVNVVTGQVDSASAGDRRRAFAH